MNHLYVAIGVVSLLAIILSIHYGTKNCCGMPGQKHAFDEGFIPAYDYAAPGSDEADARMWQTDWLPPADDLTERGGSYMQLGGPFRARPLTRDPWTEGNIHLT
jgi:hypothetical protein